MKYYHDLYLKCDVLLLADNNISNKCSKANNKSLKSYDPKPKTRIKKDHILRRK